MAELHQGVLQGWLVVEGSHVRSPSAEHVWLTRWCLGPDGNGGGLSNRAALLVVVLDDRPRLLILGVIYPAVWSRKKTRRTAALDVLDRILRRKR